MIDLHTHSSVSDGTDTPAELVRAAAEAGLSAIALTDHDTFAGLPEARAEGNRRGVGVLGGIELSTMHDGHSVHLLGYGCDPEHPDLAAELDLIQRSREERVPRMAQLLTELGMPITVADIEAQAAGVSVGRPHVADALVAHGYVTNRNEAFDRFLHDGGPAYIGRYAPTLARGIELVQGARGAAVVAHPWGRGGRHHLTLTVLESLAHEPGLDGIEVDHNDHDPESTRELRDFAAAAGLLATGGSDYHGTGKLNHPLGCHTASHEVYEALVGLIGSRGGTP